MVRVSDLVLVLARLLPGLSITVPGRRVRDKQLVVVLHQWVDSLILGQSPTQKDIRSD